MPWHAIRLFTERDERALEPRTLSLALGTAKYRKGLDYWCDPSTGYLFVSGGGTRLLTRLAHEVGGAIEPYEIHDADIARMQARLRSLADHVIVGDTVMLRSGAWRDVPGQVIAVTDDGVSVSIKLRSMQHLVTVDPLEIRFVAGDSNSQHYSRPSAPPSSLQPRRPVQVTPAAPQVITVAPKPVRAPKTPKPRKPRPKPQPSGKRRGRPPGAKNRRTIERERAALSAIGHPQQPEPEDPTPPAPAAEPLPLDTPAHPEPDHKARTETARTNDDREFDSCEHHRIEQIADRRIADRVERIADEFRGLDFASRLSDALDLNSISVAEVATKTKLPSARIAGYLDRVFKRPQRRDVIKLGKVLGIDLTDGAASPLDQWTRTDPT